MAVLVFHPFQHASAPVVVEVGVDIGQGDAVGVEETLEQEVVLHRVDLGDAQAIGHHATRRRATPGTHHHAELFLGGLDEVLHDEKVAGKSHRLHDVELEAYAVVDFLGEGCLIALAGSLVGELRQIVGLELDAVELVVAAQVGYLLLAILAGERVLAVLVGGELAEEVFLGEFLAPLLFRSELLGNGEEGHDGVVVEAIELHLVENLDGVGQRLGNVGKHLVHLLARLEPLLLGVEHARGVVEVFARGETQEVVVGLGVVLVHEVAVVGADELHAVFLGEVHQHAVHLLLQGEGLAVGADVGVGHLVAHQFQVVVVAEHALVPLNHLLRSRNVVVQDAARHLSRQACRAADDALVVAHEVVVVGARAGVESVGPRARYYFNKVVVALLVLCQQDEVVAAVVAQLLLLALLLAVGHIHLAPEDGLEGLEPLLLAVFVHTCGDVEELLDAEHVAVVGDGHSAHAVVDGFLHEVLDARLAVEYRVVGVYVQVYEVFHRGK